MRCEGCPVRGCRIEGGLPRALGEAHAHLWVDKHGEVSLRVNPVAAKDRGKGPKEKAGVGTKCFNAV